MNREGVFIIPPRYEHVRDFSEGKAIVLLGENRYAFVDSAGVQGEETYFTAQPYSGGFAAVRKVGLDSAGFIDHSGKTAFPDLNARDTHSFSEGLAAATDPASELAGYIDTAGQWVIPPKYITANPFAEGYAAVKESEHYGIIDREGTSVSESRFDDILGFSEGMAPFRSGNNWGAMNTEMRVVIDPVYAYIGPFHDGLAKAVKEQGGKYGYIGKDGRWAIPPVYRDAQDFHNGLAAVKVDGKYGFIDTKGQMVLPPRYDEVIQPFAYDTAFVRIGGDCRYITREGEILFGEPSP
ncbi:WG repeat-containing protein [Paenibacillus thermoaerophilus]|uniref:WG repeat-containing protein n=1 Tax=Paenibacillus thermoaerophilus TaxID=1215385 RepID=A0ABW2V260_9BACL|nr:WG repeat-containing protein [Paenibacillus thermoaerophilus]